MEVHKSQRPFLFHEYISLLHIARLWIILFIIRFKKENTNNDIYPLLTKTIGLIPDLTVFEGNSFHHKGWARGLAVSHSACSQCCLEWYKSLGSSRGQIAKSFYMFKKYAVASFDSCNSFEVIKRTLELWHYQKSTTSWFWSLPRHDIRDKEK